MVRPAQGTVVRMVELRAVEAAFPLYGTVGLDGGQVYSHALLAEPGRTGAAGAADGARGQRSATVW